MYREVLLLKLVDERYRFQSTVALVDIAVLSFLQNSREYGLGSLRKKPYGGHPNYSPMFQLALITQPNFFNTELGTSLCPFPKLAISSTEYEGFLKWLIEINYNKLSYRSKIHLSFGYQFLKINIKPNFFVSVIIEVIISLHI